MQTFTAKVSKDMSKDRLIMKTPPHPCKKLTACKFAFMFKLTTNKYSPYKLQLRQVKDQSKLMRPPHHAKVQHNLPYTHASKFKQNHGMFTFHTRTHG